MFKRLNERVVYRVSYVSLTVLLACSIPLMLASLPEIKVLCIVSIILSATLLIMKWKCLGYPLIFCITIMHFVFQANSYEKKRFKEEYVKRDIGVKVKVVDFPKVYQNRYRNKVEKTVLLTVKVLSNSSLPDGAEILYQGSILKLSCYRCRLAFSLGEEWDLTVKLKPPKGNASWGVFDYEKYAYAHKIVASGYIKNNQAELLGKSLSTINKFRVSIQKIIKEALTKDITIREPKLSRALLLALTIGDRSELDSNNWKVFQSTGTSHLMAISGLHITLMFLFGAGFVRFFVKLLGVMMPLRFNRLLMEVVFFRVSVQTISMSLGLIFAVTYALASGLSLPTQRAILMLGIFCVSQLLLRKMSLFNSLCSAVIVLLILSPLSTLHIGFWLSVLAVLMITVLIKSKELAWLMQWRLAISMIPVSLLLFDNAPLMSPIANSIAIPVIGVIALPITFLLVFISALLSMLPITFSSSIVIEIVFKGLQQIWGFLDTILNMLWFFLQKLSFIQKGMHETFYGVFPHIEMFSAVVVSSVFIILTWRLLLARTLVVFSMLFLLLIKQNLGLNKHEFNVTVLDVGQGLAIIIETLDSYTVFDAGIAFSHSDSAEKIILPYLNKQERKPISKIIISHSDNDHIGGLKTLHSRYPMVPILINDVDSSPTNSNAQSCYEKEWEQSGVTFKIFANLNLLMDKFQDDKLAFFRGNNASCVMKVSSSYGSILLPADIERFAEHTLVQNYASQLNADVLIAAHHGSRSSSTPVFLHQVKPSISVISAAYFSPYGHPHKDVMERLRKSSQNVLSTARSGSIKIDFLKDGIQTREYRALHPRFWYSEP